MASSTLSIRVPEDTRRWLEHFAQSRGSVGSAASRLLEEGRRRELFRGIEFRDTPLGRLAHVQGTRISVAFAGQAAESHDHDAAQLAAHFRWPLWKAESVLAYLTAYPSEIARNREDLERREIEDLKALLPGLEMIDVDLPPR